MDLSQRLLSANLGLVLVERYVAMFYFFVAVILILLCNITLLFSESEAIFNAFAMFPVRRNVECKNLYTSFEIFFLHDYLKC